MMNRSAFTTLRQIVGMMFDRRVCSRANVAFAILTEVVTIALMLAGPYFLKMAIDALSATPANGGFATIAATCFVLSWATAAVVSTSKLAFTGRIIESVTRSIIRKSLQAQLPLAASGDGIDTGRVQGVLERLPYMLGTVVEGLLWKVVPLLIQILVALVVVSMLVPLSYVAIMALVMIGYFAFAHFTAAKYERAASTTNEAAGELSAAMSDVLRNAQRVVFNGAIDIETDFVGAKASHKLQVSWERSWLLIRAAIMQYGALGAGLTILLAMAAMDTASGRISLGDFVLLQTYAFQFALPLGAFAYVLRQADLAIANIGEALTLTKGTEARDRKSPLVASSAAAAISVSNLDFNRNGEFALSDVSFSVPAGAFIAIVGPNGAGKSTLARILGGILEPQKGMVELDGKSLQGVPKADRYRYVLYVPQSVLLFNRSLRDNVRYHPSILTDEEIRKTLGAFAFHEDGQTVNLDLQVGEKGGRLSGGQVQKMELARLTGVQVPAMILDETTSALDAQSEVRIIGDLRSKLHGRSTLVLITHRIANVEKADAVIFMTGGRVAAMGPHSELMSSNMEYRSFWERAPVDAIEQPSRREVKAAVH